MEGKRASGRPFLFLLLSIRALFSIHMLGWLVLHVVIVLLAVGGRAEDVHTVYLL